MPVYLVDFMAAMGLVQFVALGQIARTPHRRRFPALK
jgi:hypothetical protein